MTNEQLFPNTGTVSVDTIFRKKFRKAQFVGRWKPTPQAKENLEKIQRSIVNPKDGKVFVKE